MMGLLQRAALLTCAGAALGLVGNQFSPRGIPVIAPPKKQAKAEEFIPLEKARELWHSGASVFLDARSPQDYADGHIGNAINLPALEFEKHFSSVAPMLSPEGNIVVYCDGTECELSHKLADALKQQGFTNTHVLFNGWTVWRTAGLPTQTGGEK